LSYEKCISTLSHSYNNEKEDACDMGEGDSTCFVMCSAVSSAADRMNNIFLYCWTNLFIEQFLGMTFLRMLFALSDL
jgi:hypothetical protein